MKESTEIRKEALVEQWLEQISDPDEGDRALIMAVASKVEKAYNRGLKDKIKTN